MKTCSPQIKLPKSCPEKQMANEKLVGWMKKCCKVLVTCESCRRGKLFGEIHGKNKKKIELKSIKNKFNEKNLSFEIQMTKTAKTQKQKGSANN